MEFVRFQELKTPRLLLRKLNMEDAQDFYRFAGSAAVTKHMLWKPHRDVWESAASIEKTLRRYDEGKCYRWAIALCQSDELIGIIDLLSFDEVHNTCSFAYMLAQDHWGMGYGTEALKAVLEFAFSQMHVTAVAADHFAQNPASGAVMTKVGMVRCAAVPGKYEKNGIAYDAIQYYITKEQWESGIS